MNILGWLGVVASLYAMCLLFRVRSPSQESVKDEITTPQDLDGGLQGTISEAPDVEMETPVYNSPAPPIGLADSVAVDSVADNYSGTILAMSICFPLRSRV